MEKIKGFLSAVTEDQATAERIYYELKNADAGADITPWWTCKNMLGGMKIDETIAKTIKESSYFLSLLSSNSISKRGSFQRELEQAFNIVKEIPAGKIYLIPAKLDPCEIVSEELKERFMINLYPYPSEKYREGIDKIIEVILNHTTGVSKVKTEKISGNYQLKLPLNRKESETFVIKDNIITLTWEGENTVKLPIRYEDVRGENKVSLLKNISGYPQMDKLTSFLDKVKFYWGGWYIAKGEGRKKLKEYQPVSASKIPVTNLPQKDYLQIAVAVSTDKAVLEKVLSQEIPTPEEAAKIIWVIYEPKEE